ncbi:MAG: DEAD/DEAH box helicase [Pseudonocardia sp.]|nr:DEAD/DEAH box helicase [Pseudonocardia sp.]
MSLHSGIEPEMAQMMDRLPTEPRVAPRELRDYQREAADAVEADWAAGIKYLGVVLPTGSGKSTVIGELTSRAYRRGQRVVCLAHRGELLDQMRRDLIAVDPDIPVEHMGIVRAESDDHHAPIVFASLQTLATAHRRLALGKRDVVFWDEVHHAGAAGYHATFRELVEQGGYGEAFMCGFTATMYRSEETSGRAAKIGLGDVIEKIAYERDLRWAIEQGFLVAPTGLTVRIDELNALNKIRNVAGDFHQGDLAEVMEAAVEYTVDAIEMHASDRKSIVFAASVDASAQIAELLNERGNLSAAAITGAMSLEQRQPIYQAFRDGEIDVIVTVMVLTEGADFPMCDCVVMARPTRSRVLYSQMVGRALRLYEGKSDALVLDLAGTTRHMRLIHLSELVHGLDIDTVEVDEDGEEIDPNLCPFIGEPTATCECTECVEAREAARRISIKREGPVDMTPIDLLADDDDTLWLRTPKGVHFVPLSEGWIVFIWPRDGRIESGEYAVGAKNTRTRRGGFAETGVNGEPVYHPMATAMRKAGEWVVDSGFQLPAKFASWRRGNRAPSEAQVNLARRLHVVGAETFTKGRLSDEISIAMAKNVLDEFMEV